MKKHTRLRYTCHDCGHMPYHHTPANKTSVVQPMRLNCRRCECDYYRPSEEMK